jgi:hypothetical protein
MSAEVQEATFVSPSVQMNERNYIPEPCYDMMTDEVIFNTTDCGILPARISDSIVLHKSPIDDRAIGFSVKCIRKRIFQLNKTTNVLIEFTQVKDEIIYICVRTVQAGKFGIHEPSCALQGGSWGKEEIYSKNKKTITSWGIRPFGEPEGSTYKFIEIVRTIVTVEGD